MSLNLPKIERVAAAVVQALREEKARAQQQQVAEGRSADDWPLFFHPIDVAHDWFYARHADDRAFGRLRRAEFGLIERRIRELLQSEIEEYTACRQREREREEASYRAWCEQAAPEIEQWRRTAEGA